VTPPVTSRPPETAAPALVLPEQQSTRRAITSIRQMRTLYISKMDDDLDELLREEVRKQMGKRVRLVRSAEEADGVMRLDLETQDGGRINTTGRVLGIRGKKNASVKIFDRGGQHLLWQEEASDRRGFGGISSGGDQKLASRIVGKLRKELE
jgi:hypothetical protein